MNPMHDELKRRLVEYRITGKGSIAGLAVFMLEHGDAILAALAENERLRGACGHFDTALLVAFPKGAKGEVFDAWNFARSALTAGDSHAD